MKLNPPKKVTFWVSIFAFVIGIALSMGVIPAVPVVFGFILAMLAYLLLVLGLIIKGL
ncbi:MAG: hypothetical protein GX417_04510 [Clostridiales bacterium]|nr:hypothetical protein [Clostridiales bacterium]